MKHRRIETIDDTFSSYGRVEAMCKLVNDSNVKEEEWRSYLWNKVYKQEMFKGVVFPVGRGLDEDYSVMHQILHNAEKVVYNKSEFYYYYHVQGSISSNVLSDEDSAKKAFDRCSAIWERYVFIKEHTEYHRVLTLVQNQFVSDALAVLRYAYKHLDLFPKNYTQMVRKQILDIDLPLSKQMPDHFNTAKKIEFFIFKHSLPLYKFLARMYKKRYWQYK